MKRFYLAPMVGAGTDEDPRRPKVADYPVNWTSVGTVDSGVWTLCLVAALNHTALVNDTALFVMPDITFDVTVGALSKAEQNRLKNGLTKFGIGDLVYGIGTSYRELLQLIAARLTTGFNENNFDVKE